MPARVSSGVTPSLALNRRTGLPSTPPSSLIVVTPTLTALSPAMPISLPGPVDGSSVPIVSTPSAEWAIGSEVATPEVSVTSVDPVISVDGLDGCVVTGALAAARPSRSSPHAAVVARSTTTAKPEIAPRLRIWQTLGPGPTDATGTSSSVSDVSDDVERREQLSTCDLVRWSEALAAIARTGLGFTQNLYERERFEEVLRVAADIKMAADRCSSPPTSVVNCPTVEEWMQCRRGRARLRDPQDGGRGGRRQRRGEILLVQRADSGFWLYPTGWADVGYSPAEVAVKEVAEETGIECVPEQLLAVVDGQRMGFSRFAMYMLLFHCTATGGELVPHPLETADVGWFSEGSLPAGTIGAPWWGPKVFGAIRGERYHTAFDGVRSPIWRS